MFGLFLAGLLLLFVLIFLSPLSLNSRWIAFPVAVCILLATICVTVASIIGTAIAIVFRNALVSLPDLGIGAQVGKEMFAFMWIAATFATLASLIQLSLCCCCTSRRNLRTIR